MQMCADVFHSDVIVPLFDNVPARGAAACAAVAAGAEYGEWGCKDFEEASERLIPKERMVYHPDKEKGEQYDKVYACYRKLHDAFGPDDSFMKTLKELRNGKKHHE